MTTLPPVGSRVRVTEEFVQTYSDNSWDTTEFPADRIYTVTHSDNYAIGVYLGGTAGFFGDGHFSVGVYGWEMVADASGEETLESFKRRVVTEALKAKVANEWCSEAEAVLRAVGLGDYLPVEETVEIVVRRVVTRTPGQSDYSVRRAAQRDFDLPEGAWTEETRILSRD